MVAWLVYAIAFGVYAWTAAPGVTWLDSPEFAAAAWTLGVAHSPGHPLVSLLGKLASLVPLGDIAFRVNLASAAAAAAAAAVMTCAAREVLSRAAPAIGQRARELCAAAIALVFALSWAAWSQAVRAEVYSLQSALCAGMLLAVLRHDRTRSRRALLAAGVCAGLALANHHLIALLAIVPAAVLVLWRRSARVPSALSQTAVAGVFGLAALLYLPVRSAQSPPVNWGAPHTAERFAWTVSARAFQKTTTAEHVSTRGEDAAQVVDALATSATWPLAVLALIGFAAAVRDRRQRALGLALAGVCALGVAGRVLVGFDPETADHHGYLLPALVGLLLLAALGAGALSELARAGPWIAAGGLLALVPLQLLSNGGRASLRAAHGGDEMARWELEQLPPRALVLLGYFETSFRISALRALEQARPDLAILDRSFLTYPGTAEQSRQRYPELAALIDAPLRADRPAPLAELAATARTRPIVVQLHLNLDRDVLPHLLPLGPMALFLPGPAPPSARDGAETHDDRSRADVADRVLAVTSGGDLGDARRALLWHDAMRMSFYCQVGRKPAAARAFASAWSLFPGDSTLAEQADSCGLEVPP